MDADAVGVALFVLALVGGGLLLWRHATRREAEADQARRRRAQARGWHYDGRSRGITQFTIRGGDATLVWTFKHEYTGVSESPPTTSQWSTRDRRARPVPAGSAAFRQRFTVLAHDPSLGHAAIDGRIEDLLLRSPRPSDPGWRSDRHVSVWLDEFGLRVQCDASLVEVDEIEHVVALGLALAERCPRSAPAPCPRGLGARERFAPSPVGPGRAAVPRFRATPPPDLGAPPTGQSPVWRAPDECGSDDVVRVSSRCGPAAGRHRVGRAARIFRRPCGEEGPR